MIREKLKNVRYKKEIIAIIVILFLIIAVVTIKNTYAFYNYETAPVPIFTSKVGNFASEGESVKTGPIEGDTDVNIIFYMQMPDNPDKYKESKYVPASGYKVNDKVSNCYPDKNAGDPVYNSYTIKEDGTVSIEYKEMKPLQVTCRIYYDKDMLSDVIIYAYLKDVNGDRNYKNDKYKLINKVESNYSMIDYECKNGSKTIDNKLTYDANGFRIETDKPVTCYAYFEGN